jgi:hypothetical protein
MEIVFYPLLRFKATYLRYVRTKVYINDAPYPNYDRNRQGEYNFTCAEKI